MTRYLLLIGLVFAIFGCEDRREPNEYRMPAGYRGWLVTFYDSTNEPPLPRSGGYIVHDFTSDTLIRTGESAQYGSASDRFFVVASDGSKSPLHVAAPGIEAIGVSGVGYHYYFVGSPADRAAAPSFETWLQKEHGIGQSSLSTPLGDAR